MDTNTTNMQITTVFERDSLLTFLDQFDRIIFNAKISVKSWMDKNAPTDIKVQIMDYFTDEFLASSPEELFGKSKMLRKEILAMDTIGITVPKELKAEFTQKLVVSVADMTKRTMLLDVQIDPSIIAGATIESSGFVLEHSIRSFFEKRLKERRHHGL